MQSDVGALRSRDALANHAAWLSKLGGRPFVRCCGTPFARREHVAHQVLDHTSVLKMIEWRWGLQPLTVRDETATNLAEALLFPAADYAAKQIAVPQGPFGQLCVPGVPDITDLEWLPLMQMAADFGWPVNLPLLR
jgi:hypothetical protein